MASADTPSRIRSPSYPYIDLETAISRATRLEKFGKRSYVPLSTILPRWGYQPKSANGMKVVAALLSFGLAETMGKKDGRKIRVTDRAYRIIHDHEESEARRLAIREAALSPDIYRYCLETFGCGEDMPHDDAIRSHLILEKKFNESAVSGFLADYKKSIEFASLTKNSAIIDLDGEPETPEGDGVLNVPSPADSQGTPSPQTERRRSGINMRQDTFTLDEGVVTMQWPEKLSQSSFEDLRDWLEIMGRKLERAVSKEDAKASEED